MQEVTAILIAAFVPVLAGAVVGVIKIIQFFTRMDTKVEATGKDVTALLDNHIPHIYDRLGHIEGHIGIGKDKTSY